MHRCSKILEFNHNKKKNKQGPIDNDTVLYIAKYKKKWHGVPIIHKLIKQKYKHSIHVEPEKKNSKKIKKIKYADQYLWLINKKAPLKRTNACNNIVA